MILELSEPRAEQLLREALNGVPERLDVAALAVAALEDPLLDVAAQMDRLNEWAQRVRARVGEGAETKAQLDALRRVLVDEVGLRGNEAAYEDPDNSFLHRVMERKLGVPISLSVIWIEVARRAGIPLYGVSFPGHFLVALDGEHGRRVADPFGGGRELSLKDCVTLLRRAVPGALLTEELFLPANVRAITWRMLMNLKHIYLGRQDHERALKVEDLLLVLAPDHPGELRARAALLSSMGAYAAAVRDLEKVLDLGPAPDERTLRLAVKALRERMQFLN